MKLTIIRLLAPDTQDKIDLGKIWSEGTVMQLDLNENKRLYAAKFNDRLLGAVQVILNGTQGVLSALNVREITRRRGVGQYLIEEVLRDNPGITHWTINAKGVEDRTVMQAFTVKLGFLSQGENWEKLLYPK